MDLQMGHQKECVKGTDIYIYMARAVREDVSYCIVTIS